MNEMKLMRKLYKWKKEEMNNEWMNPNHKSLDTFKVDFKIYLQSL